ncbi:hypothetical protein [Prolixibacter sp. SD074]|uniref:hypothetical protein n=1 Tax=Prolixibacter sp. SD074 TaxID=2652391 RepID=UPI0012848581|nr:hypothetical protein [Prolixibacter sp. SD074]GET28871.1 hypothetical protein SD074_10730 [Prolixibacter sp. SD074]
MNIKYSLISILILFLRIRIGFSQTTKPLSERVKAITARYDQTLFGKNTFVFDPAMDMHEIQTLIDSIYAGQLYPANEFSENRYALLFKPGTYKLDIKVGYYMHILSLGNSQEYVVIDEAVRSVSNRDGHVLCNFWRAAENLTIVLAADSTNTWAISQAAPLRRIYVKENLKLFEGYSIGGFMGDCKIDGTVFFGAQQQWFTRNSIAKKWDGGVWNMVYTGVVNAPKEHWPEKPVTTIKQTPEVREKPYLIYSGEKFYLKIPALKKNSSGTDWNEQTNKEKTVSIDDFYVAKPGTNNAKLINQTLGKGKNILLTPGIYSLDESLKITRPGTAVIMGIGMATLVPENGNKAIEVSDADGITVAGLLIDANINPSETLMQVGKPGSKKNHAANPSYIFDVFFRVSGPHEGSASHCLGINSNDVYADHLWIWRADHGNGVGWDKNGCANGLIVNGNNVTIYGLFNEHFQEY